MYTVNKISHYLITVLIVLISKYSTVAWHKDDGKGGITIVKSMLEALLFNEFTDGQVLNNINICIKFILDIIESVSILIKFIHVL